MKLLIGTGISLIVGIMVFINYVIDKDEQERPALAMKLWLIPVLTLLAVSPIVIIALLYWGLIKAAGYFNPVVFADDRSLFGAALLLIVAFLLAEVFIHPVAAVIFYFTFKRKP